MQLQQPHKHDLLIFVYKRLSINIETYIYNAYRNERDQLSAPDPWSAMYPLYHRSLLF